MTKGSKTYNNLFAHLPAHLRPDFDVWRNTKLCYNYTSGWKAYIDKQLLDQFYKYKNNLYLYLPGTYTTNEEEYSLYQTFRYWKLSKDALCSEEKYYEIERFVGYKRIDEDIYNLVKWYGFSDSYNTWENIASLIEDVPQLVEDFMRKVLV